jgi:hypothetical protein
MNRYSHPRLCFALCLALPTVVAGVCWLIKFH